MIVRHGTLWAIAVLVLLTSVSFSESVKLRKPRKRTTARTPYQQSRIGSVIIRVMHKHSDDDLTRSASAGCANGNCRNVHNKFNFEPVNEAMSEKDNFLSDEESLRYVVHPEKYEHFVMRKNTGHANRYKRDYTFSELRSSNTDDRTVVNRDASEVSKNINKGNFMKKIYRLPLYKTISLNPFNKYTKNLSKSLSEANRTRRSLAVDYSLQRNDSDSGDASKVPKNVNKGNFTRVPLYRIVSLHGLNKYTKNSKFLSEASRARRSLAIDYSSRRNDSDYYAQRKAVMDRYYARQREINARYANRTSTTPRFKYNNVAPTSNVFNLGRIYSNIDSTARDTATFLHPSTKIDPIYSNESRYNKIPTELDNRRNFVPEIEPDFKSDTDLSQMRSSGNSERNALDYFVTPTPCTNLSSNGTFAPKTRPKQAQNCTSETEQSNEDCAYNSVYKNNTEGNLRWGKCEGKIVYQHNLLLGLRGPSNLDALFEVIIQGPVCITCVEALRYNETRATVALDSGGRGYEYAKLRLQGYENEGFSYIIKVWGINKIGEVCDK
ncbi:PREDICTED: uncharacterized protein LOC108770243 isoform X2 [Trachymyrmex cornetzi]|uniref:uncharacterized protein LOC108770243 isoform X2 n=1 Tax=Trachymyrmex cornetzi TaxID=471704 RepID=UPI00084F805D|nr:PREDICTED: uncharacterized protein LOC108770243 isoform X2 [Trachymyrmex cornetzi]